jgi:hypothetical protein
MYVVLNHQFPTTDKNCLSMGFVKVQSGRDLQFLSGSKGYIVAIWYSRLQKFFGGDGYIDGVVPKVINDVPARFVRRALGWRRS